MHLKTELSNNILKLTKWGLQSYLAGVDYINLGFVSRKDVKSNKEHILYGFFQVEPKALLTNTNFNKNIGWGIIKQISETFSNCPDGNYVLMKTLVGPKQLVKIFRVKNTEKDQD